MVGNFRWRTLLSYVEITTSHHDLSECKGQRKHQRLIKAKTILYKQDHAFQYQKELIIFKKREYKSSQFIKAPAIHELWDNCNSWMGIFFVTFLFGIPILYQWTCIHSFFHGDPNLASKYIFLATVAFVLVYITRFPRDLPCFALCFLKIACS